MAPEMKHIDVRDLPELRRIAEEVRQTKSPYVLSLDREDVAVVMPVQPAVRKRSRKRFLTADDPLSKLVGSAVDAPPTDASKIHEYLAEAAESHRSQ